MAPSQTIAIQLSEHNRRLEQLEIRMNAATKDQNTMQEDVDALTSAVFGDRHDPERRPGLIADVREIRQTTAAIDASAKKLFWMVATGIVAAILNLILKH